MGCVDQVVGVTLTKKVLDAKLSAPAVGLVQTMVTVSAALT